MSDPNGIEIQGNEFWILKVEEDNPKRLFFNEPEPAYAKIRDLIEKDDLSTDAVELLSVDCSKAEWSIRQVPWNVIAVGMLKKAK